MSNIIHYNGIEYIEIDEVTAKHLIYDEVDNKKRDSRIICFDPEEDDYCLWSTDTAIDSIKNDKLYVPQTGAINFRLKRKGQVYEQHYCTTCGWVYWCECDKKPTNLRRVLIRGIYD